MPAARGSYSFLLCCALLKNRRALRAMHLALFTMLGPGGPGFPWEWDGFSPSPSGAATQSSVDMYPVSDGTPHAKQKVHGKLASLSLASFLLHPSLTPPFACKNCLSPALSIPMSFRRMSLQLSPGLACLVPSYSSFHQPNSQCQRSYTNSCTGGALLRAVVPNIQHNGGDEWRRRYAAG